MAFNIFSTLNQNLQNLWGDAYDAYQAWKSKVGNVASTINTNLQNFWGDIYDVGSTIKKNVSNFWTQTYNQGKNVASTIQKNVWEYYTGQVNEIKAIPWQIGSWIDAIQKWARDLNYQAWNAGMKWLTGQNNSTFADIAPQIEESLSKKSDKHWEHDVEKVTQAVQKLQEQWLNEQQVRETLDEINRQDPNFFRTSTIMDKFSQYWDKIRQTALERGKEFWKTYSDLSQGKIGFGEATLRNAGDILWLGGDVIGNTLTEIPWVEKGLQTVWNVVTAIPWVKQWMEAYGEFAKNNPRAAQNIEAITNIWLAALGSTEGQKLISKATQPVKRSIIKWINRADELTSNLTTPIKNKLSTIKTNITTPITSEEALLKDVWAKTIKGKIWDVIVDIPEYGKIEKARSIIEPADTKRLVNRALSPRWTWLTDKGKLASVTNAEKNVRNYHTLVRTGKLKWDLSSLESTAQSVVDNLDEVGAKIGEQVKWVNTNVWISQDTYSEIWNAIKARWAARTPTAKILSNFVEDTQWGMNLQEAFDVKKIYQAELRKLISWWDAGTPQYSALVKWVDELSSQIDNAIETQLKWEQFKELKSQYRLMKSMVWDITNSAMVEWRRAPQTFVEQLGTIQAMWDIITSPLGTAKQVLAKEIGEMNTRWWSWKALIKRLDNEAVDAYKKSKTVS